MRFGPHRHLRGIAKAAVMLAVGVGAFAAPATAAEPIIATLDAESRGLDAGCVSKAALGKETERFVGRKVFGAAENADVVVVLNVREPDSADILLYDPERRALGRRTIRAESCAELQQGLALALSLMLDFTTDDVERLRESEAAASAVPNPVTEPTASAAPTDTPPTPTSAPDPTGVETPDAEPTPPDDKPEPSTPTSPQRSVKELQAGIDGRVGFGFAPVPVWGIGARFGVLTAEQWLVEVQGAYWFPRKFSSSDGTIELSAGEGGIVLLPLVFQVGPTRARVGGLGALSRVQLRGSDYPEASSGSALTLRAGLHSRLELRAGPLLAQVSAQLETPLIGYRAVVETEAGPSEQFRVSPLIFTAGAGLGVPFQ